MLLTRSDAYNAPSPISPNPELASNRSAAGRHRVPETPALVDALGQETDLGFFLFIH